MGLARPRVSDLRETSVERDSRRVRQVVGPYFESVQRTCHNDDSFGAFRVDLNVDVIAAQCALTRDCELHLAPLRLGLGVTVRDGNIAFWLMSLLFV